MLLLVHQFGLLTRQQIERLAFTPSTSSACKRRLTLLYHNGYLGRLPLPIRNAYGATRAVYFLERPGERALGHAGLIDAEARSRRPYRPGELFLQHRLDINDVRVAFTLAARGHDYRLDWWDEDKLRRLRTFDVRLGSEELRLIPDSYFTLGGGSGGDGFAVEVDRGTVPERHMLKRYLAYGEFTDSGAYQGRLPCQSFRVLTVVTGSKAAWRLGRLKTICESFGGRSLFWFTDRTRMDAADVLAERCWFVAGQESPRSLPLSFA